MRQTPILTRSRSRSESWTLIRIGSGLEPIRRREQMAPKSATTLRVEPVGALNWT
jgi:hypothetical protein